jgi:hypothetical protein
MRLDGVHVHLYCFIVVVKQRPRTLFGSLKPDIKMAASPVLANSLKVVGALRPCFENLVTRTVVKSSKKGRWVICVQLLV